MRYKIGTYPDATGGEKIFRHNDGAMNIMAVDSAGDAWPVLMVPRVTYAPRGKAWNTPDPQQEAWAQHVAHVLNVAHSDGQEPAGLQLIDADAG